MKKKRVIIFVSIVAIIVIAITVTLLANNRNSEQTIGDGSFDELNEFSSNIQLLYENEDYKDAETDEKAEHVINLLNNSFDNQNTVFIINKQSISYKKDTQIIEFEFESGIKSGVILEPMDSRVAGANGSSFDDSKTPLLSIMNSSKSENKADIAKAIITYGWNDDKADYDNGNHDNFYGLYSAMIERYQKESINIELVYQPSIDDYRSDFCGCDFISIGEHGCIYSDSPTFVAYGEKFTPTTFLKNSSDLKANRIYLLHATINNKAGFYYFIAPSFFSYYYGDSAKTTDAIVFLGSCHGFGNIDSVNTSFAKTFVDDCSAKAFIGFTNPVFIEYGLAYMDSFIHNITNGNSIAISYEEAKAEVGVTDYDYCSRNMLSLDAIIKKKIPSAPVLYMANGDRGVLQGDLIEVYAKTIYQPILEKYENALKENWTQEQFLNAGLPGHLGLNYQYPELAERIGYCIMDINQDGVEELLIGSEGWNYYFYDLYTIVDGTAKQVPIELQNVSVCEDGKIQSDPFDADYSFYVLSNGELVFSEGLFIDNMTYYKTDDYNAFNNREAEKSDVISEKEYQAAYKSGDTGGLVGLDLVYFDNQFDTNAVDTISDTLSSETDSSFVNYTPDSLWATLVNNEWVDEEGYTIKFEKNITYYKLRPNATHTSYDTFMGTLSTRNSQGHYYGHYRIEDDNKLRIEFNQWPSGSAGILLNDSYDWDSTLTGEYKWYLSSDGTIRFSQGNGQFSNKTFYSRLFKYYASFN